MFHMCIVQYIETDTFDENAFRFNLVDNVSNL